MRVPFSAERVAADCLGGLTESEIRDGLARVLNSPGFRVSLRLTHFLTFVVEATLSGNAQCIKAYTIAVEALGRDYDFDPERDAIVRVEAGRLRQALNRYYANDGRDDPLLITLPRGTYVPSFARPGSAFQHFRSGDIDALGPASLARFVAVGDQAGWLNLARTSFGSLTEFHRLQMRAVSAQIESALQALKNAEGMMLAASEFAPGRAGISESTGDDATRGAVSAKGTTFFSETAFRMLESLRANLRGGGDLLQVAETILGGIVHLHKSDFGTLQLYDAQSRELVMLAYRGFHTDLLRPFSRIAAASDQYISARAAHSRQPIVVADVLADEQFPLSRAGATATGYRALQATPMITSDARLVGVLATQFAQAESYTGIDMLMTQFYARLAADVLVPLLPPPGQRISVDRFERTA